jgi:photosystem II stability/assembly factor-like uncharacterized protein
MLTVLSASALPFQDPLAKSASMHPKPNLDRMTAVSASGGRVIGVGADGLIVVSDDNGITWRQGTVPVSSDLVAVRFLNKQKAWAVGHDGVILQTRDGGKTWGKQLDGLEAAKLMQSYYESQAKEGPPRDAKLVSDVKRFVDEGADKPFFDVLFLNDNDGFAVGAFNLAFRTCDGGRNWIPLFDRTDNPQGLHLYSLAIANSVLYLVGEQGLIRRWNPEKAHFEPVDSPYKGSLFGAIGNGAQLVVFGLSGNVFRSADGGANWVKLETHTTAGIVAGTFLPDGRAVLTTATGTLLVSNHALSTFSRVAPAKPMAYAGIAPTGAGSVALAGGAGLRIELIKNQMMAKPE